MSAPRLQDVLAEHQRQTAWYGQHDGWWECTCMVPDGPAVPWSPEHQAAVWREACMVRTVAQLDALPRGALLAGGHCRDDDGPVERGESRWTIPGSEVSLDSDMVHLPALLVWHPDWSGQ